MSHECCEGVRGLKFSRRYFLKRGGIALVGMSAMPAFLQRAAAATAMPNKKQLVVLRRADHVHFIDDVESQHEALRAMPLSGELAWIPKEMRPISELCSGDQAHLFTRGLALAHFDHGKLHLRAQNRIIMPRPSRHRTKPRASRSRYGGIAGARCPPTFDVCSGGSPRRTVEIAIRPMR